MKLVNLAAITLLFNIISDVHAGEISDRIKRATGFIADRNTEATIASLPKPNTVDRGGSCTNTEVPFQSADAKANGGWDKAGYSSQLILWAIYHFGTRAGNARQDPVCMDGEFAARAWQSALGDQVLGLLSEEQARRFTSLVQAYNPSFASVSQTATANVANSASRQLPPAPSQSAGLFGVQIGAPLPNFNPCPVDARGRRRPVYVACTINLGSSVVFGVRISETIGVALPVREAPDWLEKNGSMFPDWQPMFFAHLWEDGTVALVHAPATRGDVELTARERFGEPSGVFGEPLDGMRIVWQRQGGDVELVKTNVGGYTPKFAWNLYATGDRWKEKLKEAKERAEREDRRSRNGQRPL